MRSGTELKTELVEHLRTLHLPSFRDCFEEEALRATRESLAYEHYLLELAALEVEGRSQRRIVRSLRESRLPLEKDLDSFDLTRLSRKVQMQVKSLLDGEFLGRCENVLAFGNPGSGKTHLLCAIGQELIHRGHRILFTSCSLLVQELLTGKRDLKLAAKLKRLGRYAALIIDSCGVQVYVESPPGRRPRRAIRRRGLHIRRVPIVTHSASSHSRMEPSDRHATRSGFVSPIGPALAMAARFASRSTWA